jgi:K+-sensing histidine kinase KdpD
MEEAHCPVIVVPTSAEFDGIIDHIGVATHFTPEDTALVEALRRFRDIMRCHLHVIHIDTTAEHEGIEKMKSFYEPWQQDKKMTAHCVPHQDINEGLEAFIKDQKIDVLAILSQRRSWFDEIFEKNRAKELSYHQSIPLLVFQKENLGSK